MTDDQALRCAEIAVMALAEVGYEAKVAEWDPGAILHLDEPPCDVAYKAFALAKVSLGLPNQGFDHWHSRQDRRRTCTCRG